MFEFLELAAKAIRKAVDSANTRQIDSACILKDMECIWELA
jgi:hypothetical protein